MKKKVLIIMCVLLVLIIIFYLGKYFHKYYVITKYQEKIAEIEENGNYKFEYGDIVIYAKDNIYVQKSSDTSYIIFNNNTNEIFTLSKEGIQEIEQAVSITISNIFMIDDLSNEINILNVKNSLIYSELTNEEFNGKNCYKLTYETETMPNKFTVYFEKENYLPVGFCYENASITYVQIYENIVEDEDISESAIMERIESSN